MTNKPKLELLTAVLAPAGVLCSQETGKTLTNPSPDPKDDTKPNSSSVPDAVTSSYEFPA